PSSLSVLVSMFRETASIVIYILSLHDALPISLVIILFAADNRRQCPGVAQFGSALEWGSRGREFDSRHSDQIPQPKGWGIFLLRSEEHTSELQSRFDIVCRLLLEKKKINDAIH